MWLFFVPPKDALGAESPRYPISAARIAQALVDFGLKVTPEEVRLPAPFSATSLSPQLELISMRSAAPGLVQLEMRCHVAGECLPFFALIDVPGDAVQPLLAEFKKNQLGEGKALRSGAEQVRRNGAQAGDGGMRAGTHVALLLEDGQMRIQLPGVALDSGAPGCDVRVSSLDHRKIFHASVVDSGVARGGVE